MDMLKIGIVGIVGVLAALLTKQSKAEFTVYISMGTCIIIFFYAMSKMEFILDSIGTISGLISIKATYITSLVKIIGITYISEFSSNICKDAGFGTIASQIEIFSKLSILAVSMPILMALFETINGFLN
ncbi:MAG TPA: stage III sporulation protein AD [Candidatus Merdenecus merdavium]|nr:stage III sporulation protein AD [Candidatus Merdenecus merdavium]